MIQISKATYPKSTYLTIKKVIKNGKLTQGKFVEEFEEQFAKYIGCNYAVAVNSGTSALHLSLLGLGIGSGDEVIVPAFTFAATANVVSLVGAVPIFIDVDESSFNIKYDEIESQISNRTKAIIIVHLYGMPCDMKPIVDLARKHDLILIEDCAQACGAQIYGKPVGSFGDVGCFSFYASKNLSTGEGGMITTNNPSLERILRLYRNQGMIFKYQHEIPGFNNRMNEISAILGLSQLTDLDTRNSLRILNADFYNSNLPESNLISLPKSKQGVKHVYHQYTLKVEPTYRDHLTKYLNEFHIEANVYYPIPTYRLEAFQKKIFLKNSENLSRSVLSIPVHPHLKKRERVYIVDKICQWLSIISKL